MHQLVMLCVAANCQKQQFQHLDLKIIQVLSRAACSPECCS